MAKFLSKEYIELQKKLGETQPERPGVTAKMQYVVTDGPDGDVTYYWVLENGKLIDAALGANPETEVTLTQTYEIATKIAKLELDPSAAFMQGRIKITGMTQKVMQLLPLTNSPEYKELMKQLKAQTDFEPVPEAGSPA